MWRNFAFTSSLQVPFELTTLGCDYGCTGLAGSYGKVKGSKQFSSWGPSHLINKTEPDIDVGSSFHLDCRAMKKPRYLTSLARASPLQVADLWQAELPAQAASDILCLRTTTFPFSEVYNLPPVLKSSAAYSAVMAEAEASLVAVFGNAPEIILSPELLNHFLTLPHPALLALIQSDEFKTDAEESVLLLVSSWCDEPVGEACSIEQIRELNSFIRYGDLSRPYLTDLCDVHMTRLPQLTREQLLELWAFPNSADEDNWDRFESINPPEWYAGGRSSATASERHAVVKLFVTVPQLRGLLAAVGDAESDMSIQSTNVYAQGFLWMLELQIIAGALWTAISAFGVSDVHDLSLGMNLKHGVRCVSEICLERPAGSLALFRSDCKLVTTRGNGSMLTGPAGEFPGASLFEWWEGYVVDGCVRLIADIRPTSLE